MLARFRPSLTLVGAVALVIAIANPAAAPPGDLDTTFDGDGKVTTDFFGDFDLASGVAIQGDGKIVAAGRSTEPGLGGATDFALARYNADGSLDTTFDGDGKVNTRFGPIGESNVAYAVAIQGDGKIVAAGVTFCGGFCGPGGDFALARYNTDGSLDPTFDTDGRVTTSGTDAAFAVAIQADGKIVAAGCANCFTSAANFALARYNTDGSLDTVMTTDFAGDYDEARGVDIQGDGKIVAAGLAFVSGTNDFAAARYNTDGSLDTTFDADGRVTTDFAGGSDLALGMAIQGDGKIVAAGRADVSGNDDFALTRYNTDGSLDSSFDGDGKVTSVFAGTDDEASAVAIQGDGKIVAAGSTDVSGPNDFALARYNGNGSLDTTFSGDGKVTTDFAGSSDDDAQAVAIQANGRIVAAGLAFVSGTYDFALARYTCFRRTSRPTSIPVCP